jgi:selenocysteine-specific elongation factor
MKRDNSIFSNKLCRSTLIQKPFLLILCGIPSSGKSRLAEEIANRLTKEHGYLTVIVASDTFRHMTSTYKSRFEPELEEFVRGATYRTIEEALRNGLLVISDDTNYYRSIRRHLKRIAERARAGFAIIYVNTPLDTALKWNKERGEPIPNTLIEEIHQKLDSPGEKYTWDTPIHIADMNKNELNELTNLLIPKIIQETQRTAVEQPKKKTTKIQSFKAALDRETRKAMGEIIRRYKNAGIAVELSDLRKLVEDEAVTRELSVENAVGLYYNRVKQIIEKSKSEVEKSAMVHIGLFGHIDHGKTQLARCLTEIPSTASLDKHPQAQKRGMSIDMGFSAFNLANNAVTLVDLPGHHSLIRHVVAGANIIDHAILVVAADEGPQVQTKEHLQILNSLGIERLTVAINKVDLVNDAQVDKTISEVRNLLNETSFKDSPMMPISAIKCEGIQQLKNTLAENLTLPIRNWSGDLKIPISHSFHISGVGTVVTGTILRGNVKVGDEIEVAPTKKSSKVRGIQIFGKNVEEASAGDRVGLILHKVRSKDISRGDLVVAPNTLENKDLLDMEVEVNKQFTGKLGQKDVIHISIGLKTNIGKIYPYATYRSMKIVKKNILPGNKCNAIVKLQRPLPVEIDDKALLVKLDLPHNHSRVIGIARIAALPRNVELYSARVKKGTIEKKLHEGYLITGLFKTKEAAEYVAKNRRKLFAATSKATATIINYSGDEGDVIASFKEPPTLSEEVHYYRLRKIRVD